MHRRFIILLWLTVVLSASALLAGCGQKGDLYLPDPAQQQEETKKK